MKLIAYVLPLAVLAACSSHNSNFGDQDGGDDSDGGGPFGKDGGPKFSDSSASDSPTTGIASCSDAAAAKSYVGCDYWPTVTGNNVWSIFDYAVVVANAGNQNASITITGPNNTNQQATVPPLSLQKFYLPWVKSLKGPDSNGDGLATPMTASVLQKGGAYHLVS